VTTVAVVHEHVHQRAGEHEEVGQHAEDMCRVLGELY
jgi:hypothetical protein